MDTLYYTTDTLYLSCRSRTHLFLGGLFLGGGMGMCKRVTTRPRPGPLKESRFLSLASRWPPSRQLDTSLGCTGELTAAATVIGARVTLHSETSPIDQRCSLFLAGSYWTAKGIRLQSRYMPHGMIPWIGTSWDLKWDPGVGQSS